MTDFTTINEKSFFILIPVSDAAKTWVDINLPLDTWQDKRGVAIEARFFYAIYDAIIAGNFTIDVDE